MATATTIVLAVVTLFVSLYPRVMVSDPDFGNSLTIENASSAHYSLDVMTVVAAVLLPVVLLYQAWTYHVFRARLGGEDPGDADRPRGAQDRELGGPCERSTRVSCGGLAAVRVLLAADVVLGLVAALLVLAQAVLLARVVGALVRGASLADVREPLMLLVARRSSRARRPRGGSRWRAAAPRPTCSPSSALDLVERRLRDRPAALDGAESAEVATDGRRQASTRSRRPSLATCRRSCWPWWCRSPCSSWSR